jgi:hypothetical protein
LREQDELETMLDEPTLRRDVREADVQLAAGTGRRHAAVAKKLRARLVR